METITVGFSYVSGLLDKDSDLVDCIRKNPRCVNRLIGMVIKYAPATSTDMLLQMKAYTFGYLNIPFSEWEDLV